MLRIYEPGEGRKMRVAFMFSGGATGMKTNIVSNLQHTDLYEVSFCLTDKPDCDGLEFAEALEIPTEKLDYRKYVKKYGDKEERRAAYFSDLNNIMRDAGPDIIVTTGFMLIGVDPFVSEWYGKLMNGHPAKTYILAGPDGDIVSVGDVPTYEAVSKFHKKGYERAFVGENAVYDAVVAGEKEVRTAVFFLDHGEDTGPNIVHSPPVQVDREYVDSLIRKRNDKGVKAYCKELQNHLKYYGDRPAINKALELAATGRLGLDDTVLGETGLPYLVTLDGKPLPYGGHVME
jgi:folate-dependent phosphoribosylglycinamide formyltransferase PurN